MAKRGIEACYAAIATYSSEAQRWGYSNGISLGPIAGFNFTPANASAKDYGDNRVVEADTSSTGGTLTLELNNDTYVNKAFLLGHSVTEETISAGEAGNITATCVHYDIADEAPTVGVGAVGYSSGDQNGMNWVLKFFPIVKFSEPNDDNATKTDTPTFGHYTVEGEIFANDSGYDKHTYAYKTKAEAIAALKSILGIS